MKVIPYRTSTGIQIGCLYTPPPHRPTHEELEIQAVLLGYRRNQILDSRTLAISACIAAVALLVAVIRGLA